MRLVQWLFIVGASLFVFGIGFVVVGARSARIAPAPQSESTPLTPIASVKQIMAGIVDPAAAKVYDAVGTTVTEKGVEDVAPRNDAEWAALGDHAAALAEAGNLLMMDGRAVDRGDWLKDSLAMIDAAKATLKAVDEQSTEGVFTAGSALSTSCDSCHNRYRRD